MLYDTYTVFVHLKNCIPFTLAKGIVYGIVLIMEVIFMGIVYNPFLFDMLKNKGYSTYRLRKDKLLPESTVQKIRENKSITTDSIGTLCRLLNCQPGEILQYIPDEESGNERI